MPEPEKKTGEVRAPVWVVLLVVLGVMIVTSAAVLPMFMGEYLSALRRSSKSGESAQAGGDASDSSQSDFFSGGGMQGQQQAEQELTPTPLTVPPKFPFKAAFAYSTGESLPFKPEEINSGFVQSQLSLSIDPSVDYLLLFFAGARFNEYSRDGFPDVATVLAEVRPEEVRGIIERWQGKFAVFTDPSGVANELGRLRNTKPVLESSP
jgi:hypothetical protein